VDGGSGSCGDRNNFFYFTGIKQDGAICLISPDGSSTLYVPRYRQERLAWEGDLLVPSKERAQALSFDHIEFLGEETPRFSISLFDSAATWNTVLGVLRDWCQQGLHIGCYKHPLLLRFEQLLPTISPLLVSIDVEISRLRRRKTRDEIGLIPELVILRH
jgi:Xaa-Pro aminopeptidase